MIKVNKAYLHYPKIMAGTELSTLRQVQRVSVSFNEEPSLLTEKERKHLRRGQFAFGSIYPYVFDGLANAATHYGKEIFKNDDENYYVLKLPIDDLCEFSLMGYERYNREHFIHELLRRGSTPDKEEAKHLRYIPLGKGKYISIQPLIIGLGGKAQETISPTDLKRLMNLKTYSESMQVIRTVTIYVLKALINPLFKGYSGGWFSCPTALQAKIVHTLHELIPRRIVEENPDHMKSIDEKFHKIRKYELGGRFLRNHFLYLNTKDNSGNTGYIDVNAIDFWEHVSPSEIKIDGKHGYLRDWRRAREKIEAANSFFEIMENRGRMGGAKAFPVACPRKVYYHKDDATYRIYYKRNPEITLKRK
jgi:hypothetical protein